MRIRNKELRQRWHRKENRVKELIKQAIAEAKTGGKKEKAPKAEPKPKKAVAPKAEAKPKKAAAKKEEAAE